MSKANYIKQRLSLRDPLKESLDILEQITDAIELKKNHVLEDTLSQVQSLFPACRDFERDFPSVCFSIATGVGKTRLMGACIAYLYLQKGFKNFFVLAPNLTIYEKLIRDFGDPGYEKYVFKGISEFVHNQPVIIHGDNYQGFTGMVRQDTVHINVFNISKFNRDSGTASKGKEKGRPSRMKRLNEYLGQAYFDYLSKMDDLVVLMDEAHRYHADASKNAINELKPVLGIELTATPTDEKGNSFKNVVYEYSLAQALADGKYVKNPAIATRKDFDPKGRSPEEIEKIKLEDGVSVHENTQSELEVYTRTNNLPPVKPFILVVCRDTTHAKEVFDYINSEQFFLGKYQGKVLQIDSTTKNAEDIEQQFLTIERDDNEIEIVIHVNMLKEGWDVKNLYTIVPLRTANASVLIEQTIGRGLRLPFNGERTGVDAVDKLTVIAHDNFAKVIEEAQDPNSVLNKLSIIEIPEDVLKTKIIPVVSPSVIDVKFQQEEKKIESIPDKKQQQEARYTLDAKKLLIDVINAPEIAYRTTGLKDFTNKEIKEKVIEKAREALNKGQLNIFRDEIASRIEKEYDTVLVEYKNNIVEIPRIDLVQEDVQVWIDDFDLDTTGFAFKVLEEEIMIRGLKDNKVSTIGVLQGAFTWDNPVNQIVSEVLNHTDIWYDENAALLNKLAAQALTALESQLDDKSQIRVLVRQYRKVVAAKIYDQIKAHFHMSEPEYKQSKVLPFRRIEEWNFTAMENGYRDYREVISPVSMIPKYVFRGFEKACHMEYKFDSKTEKDFAYILENDKRVLKWMRPARNQFRIYWDNNSKPYLPDFVVETLDTIYIVEPKAEKDINSFEVTSKSKAAQNYCILASAFCEKHGGKPWRYVLVPHTQISETTSFSNIIANYSMAD
ncbi:MAG: DEAD/DEAH box helicase [Mangrovibacterium sp.]